MADDDVLDVLIIGAGFTGLSAARELAALGAKFRVVDSFTDHLGGRAYSYLVDPSLGFDHGAEYVGDLQNGIMEQIRTLLAPDALVNGAALRVDAPMEVMLLGGHRFCFDKRQAALGIQGIPPDIGLPSLLGIIAMLAEMSLAELTINTVEPWNSPSLTMELDNLTVEQWMDQKFWLTDRARDLLRISVEALLSVEPSQLSPFYLLWYTACNGGLLNEVNDDAGGPQQYWLLRGTSELAEKYAAPVRDRIDQGVRVTRVKHADTVISVETEGGRTYRARKVLVATSPATAGRIAFEPEAPPARRALFEMPMGKTIKCQLFYKTRWWYDSHGLQYDGYVGGADYPVLWVMDNTPPNGATEGPFVLMTFTVGAQVDKLGPDATDEQIRKSVLDALQYLFQDDRALAPDKIVIHRWVPTDPYVGGGPNTIFTPGTLTGAPGRLLNEPWDDKVFFASAENARNVEPSATSPGWSLFNPQNLPAYDAKGVLLPTSKAPFSSHYSDMRSSLGYMDGAMASGRFVAHQLAGSLGLANARSTAAPAASPTAHAPAPALAAFTAAEATALLNAVREQLATTAHSAQGSGWRLHDALVNALAASGRLGSRERPAVLGAVRDAAISLLEHAKHEAQVFSEDLRTAADSVEAQLRGDKKG